MKQYHWSFATLDGTEIWSGPWTNSKWLIDWLMIDWLKRSRIIQCYRQLPTTAIACIPLMPRKPKTGEYQNVILTTYKNVNTSCLGISFLLCFFLFFMLLLMLYLCMLYIFIVFFLYLMVNKVHYTVTRYMKPSRSHRPLLHQYHLRVANLDGPRGVFI